MEAPKQVSNRTAVPCQVGENFFIPVIEQGFPNLIHQAHFLKLRIAYRAQIGAEVAAVGAPILLLPAAVAGGAVNQFVQFVGAVHLVSGFTVLKFAAVLFRRRTAGDTVGTQVIHFILRIERPLVDDGGLLTATGASNWLIYPAKSFGGEWVGVAVSLPGWYS